MKKLQTLGMMVLLMLGLVVSACGGAAPAPAEPEVAEAEDEAAKIMILEPFARASMPNGAAYMTLMNEGASADTLVSAATDVAETVELHETTIDENQVMRMRPVEGGIAIPAGGSTTLKPGGLHVMLLGIKQELAVGDTFELTLTFAESGSQTVQVEVTEGVTMDHGEGEMEHNMDQMEEGESGQNHGG